MARYSISRPDGCVVSDSHRTARGAIGRARKIAPAIEGDLTISEFADKNTKTGRPIAYIGFTGEWDSRRHPLQFWNDGSPII